MQKLRVAIIAVSAFVILIATMFALGLRPKDQMKSLRELTNEAEIRERQVWLQEWRKDNPGKEFP